MIEIANEYDIQSFDSHPLLYYPEGVATLIELARQESGGLPVGCSGKGGSYNREIAEASDLILIHGNGCNRQRLYNNMTKQEPPADWSVTKGEDIYFAHRMAQGIGIELPEISVDEQYHLQRLEPETVYEGQRWIRLASLYPESIDSVDFYRDDILYCL